MALPTAAVISAILGLNIGRFGVRPFQKKTRIVPLLATLGISMILDQLAKIIFGLFTQAFPVTLPTTGLVFGGVSIGWLDIFIAVIALFSTIGSSNDLSILPTVILFAGRPSS